MTKRKRTPEERQEFEIQQANHEALVRVGEMSEEEIAYCQAYTDLNMELARAHQRNRQGEQLAQAQYGIGFVQGAKEQRWLRMAIEWLIPPDSLERLHFELSYEASVAESVEEMHRQGRQMEILKGTPAAASGPVGLVGLDGQPIDAKRPESVAPADMKEG